MSTTPEEAAESALRTAWLNGRANTTEGWRLHVEAERLAEYIEGQVREQVAGQIQDYAAIDLTCWRGEAKKVASDVFETVVRIVRGNA